MKIMELVNLLCDYKNKYGDVDVKIKGRKEREEGIRDIKNTYLVASISQGHEFIVLSGGY